MDTQAFLENFAVKSPVELVQNTSWADLTIPRSLLREEMKGPFFLKLYSYDNRKYTDPIQLTPLPYGRESNRLYFQPVTIRVTDKSTFTHRVLVNRNNVILNATSFIGPIIIWPNNSIQIRAALSLYLPFKDSPRG